MTLNSHASYDASCRVSFVVDGCARRNVVDNVRKLVGMCGHISKDATLAGSYGGRKCEEASGHVRSSIKGRDACEAVATCKFF